MNPGTEQRKLAAIMFTDMVGYSALAQRDEALALDLLREHHDLLRDLLPRFEGREIKSTGDGLLVEFSSALAAVQCAVEIQRTLAERNEQKPGERHIRIRIGIHLGDVVRRGNDVLGDGVNIAARIEPLAEPGGICVSRAVFEQIEHKVPHPCVQLSKPELKNISANVEVYKLVLEAKPATVKAAQSSRKKLLWIVLVVVVLNVTLFLKLALDRTSGKAAGATSTAQTNRAPTAVSRQRLVLLPFKSLASGEANEIFTEGLAVELFSKLSHIRGLQVIDGSGFVKAQGAEKDFAAKWRELNAGALLKGTVLKEQKQLRIRLQLLDSQTQELLKAFDFDREPDSVLALQTEAAEAIAAALQVQLLADERAQLSRKPTDNPQAYRFYLEGRAFWSRYTEAGWRRSVELFNEALRLDPNFALAYAGRADSYVQLGMDFMPPREGYTIAKTNALRAVQLQPDLAPAYVSLAQCLMWFDHDWPGAKEAFETALRLDPRYPDTYHFLAHYYESLGEMPRAIELLQQGVERDPLASVLQTELGFAYYHARRYADGAAECRKVLTGDPTFDYARYILGLNLVQAGRYDEAIQNLEQVQKPLGWASVVGDLGYAYGVAGKTQRAREILQQLRTLEASNPWAAPSAFGFVHLGLGETNEALFELERAVEARDIYMAWAKVEPRFDPLRNEPRFQAILRKMNLVPASTTNTPAPVQPKSVAVLPFVNMSSDKENEYLSDGLTEEVLNSLTRVKGLRVPARTSCFVFKGKTEDIRTIGEKLSVATVLEGSVRKAGNQLRITARLVNVADGFRLWSEIYDRDMTNIFAIQSDIATRVAEALKGQLLGAVQEPTGNIEAYKWYLKGRYFWNRRTVESLLKAIECFNQAVAIDPNYAFAYAGLADAYKVLPIYDKSGSGEAQAKARAAALKALEPDPRLAGPVATLAALKEDYDWDYLGAEADYRRAIELDPNYPTSRQWFAEMLSSLGRTDEAVMEARKALELDPLSPVIKAILGKVLTEAGRTEEAVDLLRKQVASDPSFAIAHGLLGRAYVSQGKLVEAVSEYEAASRLDENWALGELGFCYAKAGRREDAQKVLLQLMEHQRRGSDVSVAIALVHHGFGNDPQAFELLEKAATEHSVRLQFITQNPCWKDLRPHPRFQAILKKMNRGK